MAGIKNRFFFFGNVRDCIIDWNIGISHCHLATACITTNNNISYITTEWTQFKDRIIYIYIITYKVLAWLIIMGSVFDDWVYRHFFTITLDYDSWHIEFLPNDVCLTNLYEESLPVVCISVWSLVSRIESESHVTTDSQSASLSWNKAPIWVLRPDCYYCQTVAGLLMCDSVSDEKTGLSFTIAAGPRQRSHFRVRFPVGLVNRFYTLRFETSLFVATCSRWFVARGFFYPEDEGYTFLRNVYSHKIYTAPHPRKRHSSILTLFAHLHLGLPNGIFLLVNLLPCLINYSVWRNESIAPGMFNLSIKRRWASRFVQFSHEEGTFGILWKEKFLCPDSVWALRRRETRMRFSLTNMMRPLELCPHEEYDTVHKCGGEIRLVTG
jgi:hypothetical protein